MKEYDYTLSTTPSVSPSTTSYTYNTTHPDRLTKFGLNNISYNSIGYPVSYGNKRFVWFKGKLARLYDDVDSVYSSDDVRFTYDAYGRRLTKTYTYDPGDGYSGDFLIDSTTTYTYDNSGRLISELCTQYYTESASTTYEIIYLYDEAGVIGFLYGTSSGTLTPYYYHRNLQGDVISIYTATGVKCVEYAYDAFGNCKVIYSTNSVLADNNPIRYRGYYYDRETKLYYLNARYYSPEWRRFISPDDTDFLDPESVNGLNLYCYCGNDPVNYCDPSGNSATLAIILGGIALVGMGLTIGGVAFDNNIVTAIGLGMVGGAALVSGGIAIAGAFATGAVLTGVIGGVTGIAGIGSWGFMSAEIQEATGNGNWIMDTTGMSDALYNSLLLITAGTATFGTLASSVAYSFKINSITDIGKIRGSDFKGIKFTQKKNGNIVYRSLEFHHGYAHKGHKLHWQLNKWSKTGIKSRGGTAWWTMWLTRIP